jgi:hypothetical protein
MFGYDQILGNLYLGSRNGAGTAPSHMKLLSVMWPGEPGKLRRAHSIVTTTWNADDQIVADPEKMNEAADWIHDQLSKGFSVLVHCAYGVERSPLTVVWYLMAYHGMSLNKAYKLVMSKRKEVEDRRHWLPSHPLILK